MPTNRNALTEVRKPSVEGTGVEGCHAVGGASVRGGGQFVDGRDPGPDETRAGLEGVEERHQEGAPRDERLHLILVTLTLRQPANKRVGGRRVTMWMDMRLRS